MQFKKSKTGHGPERATSGIRNEGAHLLAKAVTHARRGLYTEADNFLEMALEAGGCSKAMALDLQARMYAQQGLYLKAETCWQMAKELDGDNAAYDKALLRLQQTRFLSPFFQIFHWILIIPGLVIMVLLFWQILIVNPSVVHRQYAAETTINVVHEDIVAFHDASLRRYRNLAEKVDVLPTVEDYQAMVLRLDGQNKTLREVLERSVEQLNKQLAETSELAKRGSEDMSAVSDGILQSHEATAKKLAARIDTIDRKLAEAMVALAIVDDQDKLLVRLEDQNIVFRDIFEHEISGLNQRLDETDALHAQKYEAILFSLTNIKQAIDSFEVKGSMKD